MKTAQPIVTGSLVRLILNTSNKDVAFRPNKLDTFRFGVRCINLEIVCALKDTSGLHFTYTITRQ
ncbi:MAG: hypothetical protein H0X50_10475 [Nitrosopumilus sp.]|nr:hypothetical protein [Nitrosopumilus sp.]